MHAKPRERIALVGRRDRAEQIGRILEDAGFEVEYAIDRETSGDVEVLVDGVRALTVTEGAVDSGLIGPGAAPAVADAADARARHAERMESIARLAGGIAHDFNNILSVISICTDDALERTPFADPTRDCLTDIREAVQRGTALTRDLLSFSGRSLQTTHLVDVNDVVDDAARHLRPLLGSGIVVRVVPSSKDVSVRIDPSQWTSVFRHLGVNARDAMPNGGSLTIETRDILLDPAAIGHAKPLGRYVEIKVSDTGSGIPESIRDRVFDPFFSTQGFGKTNGLGLAVVHGIVEQSGGFIDLTSEVGAGTTFRIHLPIATTVPERAAPSTPARARHEATLLLVEDEDAVRRIAFRALERAGYRVFHARSAEDALAMLPTLPPIDLLVTDVVLPGMDGRTLASTVVAQHPTVAVLYASGYTDDEVLRCGVLESEVFFLQKPYTASVLVQRVEYVLRKAALAM